MQQYKLTCPIIPTDTMSTRRSAKSPSFLQWCPGLAGLIIITRPSRKYPETLRATSSADVHALFSARTRLTNEDLRLVPKS